MYVLKTTPRCPQVFLYFTTGPYVCFLIVPILTQVAFHTFTQGFKKEIVNSTYMECNVLVKESSLLQIISKIVLLTSIIQISAHMGIFQNAMKSLLLINLSFTYKKHKLLFIKGVGNNRHNSELFSLLPSQIRTNIYNKANRICINFEKKLCPQCFKFKFQILIVGPIKMAQYMKLH